MREKGGEGEKEGLGLGVKFYPPRAHRKNYGGRSEGVREEIRYAISRGKSVYVYDPEEDGEIGRPHPFDS